MTLSLHHPAQLGELYLKNRIIMAPMTRSRATEANTPNALMAEYYSQRAFAGLIIVEGTSPSPNGLGYARMPALFNGAHVQDWKQVTAAVHAKGGKIVLQLMHAGRVAHVANLPLGAEVLGPGAERAPGDIHTDAHGMQATSTPRAMSATDIQMAVAEFARAASLAIEAGFDGVELHAGGGYLLDSFFNATINQRNDAYGGSTSARNRFILEVVQAVVAAIGAARVGIRFMPHSGANGAFNYAEMDAQYVELCRQLSSFGLMYLHLVNFESMGLPPLPVSLRDAMRDAFKGPLVLAGGFDQANAAGALERGEAEFLAFGRPFLANPDLVNRLQAGAHLNSADFATFYSRGSQGYTDYPTLAEQNALKVEA
ncbi:alkene reductase [Pseudomonas sp. BF-R-12]|uniref:alkene reductase n=1 Tax=Pseudomonas sp. BF-R-12 TaxID=2832363 RepID=UPI001CBCBE5F|nr:alkene reductase [Pseudomonas sp. BF-R-12]